LTQQSSAVASGATIQAVDHNTLVTDVSALFTAVANASVTAATVAAAKALTGLSNNSYIAIVDFGIYYFNSTSTYINDDRWIINVTSGGQLICVAPSSDLVSDIYG
jgi:hypothetical protein